MPKITICFDEGTEIFAPLEKVLHTYPDVLYKRRLRMMSADDWKRITEEPLIIKQEWRMFERDEKE
jgi:hypothetical protein